MSMPESDGDRSQSRKRSDPEHEMTAESVIAALDGMSVADLRQVARAAEARIEEKAESEKAALIEETRRRAEALGLTIKDLFGEPQQPARRGRGKAAKRPEGAVVGVKYKGPNESDVWSGRGRTPKWLAALEAQGRSREEFLVQR